MDHQQAARIARREASRFRMLIHYDASVTMDDLRQNALLAIWAEAPLQPKLWPIVARRRLHDEARRIQVRAPLNVRHGTEATKGALDGPPAKLADPAWCLDVRAAFSARDLDALLSTPTELAARDRVSYPTAKRRLKSLREDFAARAA